MSMALIKIGRKYFPNAISMPEGNDADIGVDPRRGIDADMDEASNFPPQLSPLTVDKLVSKVRDKSGKPRPA